MSILILFLIIFISLNIFIWKDSNMFDMSFSMMCIILIIASAILTGLCIVSVIASGILITLYSELFHFVFRHSFESILTIIFLISGCFLISYIIFKIMKRRNNYDLEV